MSLRLRLTLFVAGAAAFAVAVVSTAAYVSAANEVYGEVDAFLEQRIGILAGLSAFDPELAIGLPEDPMTGMMSGGGRGPRFIEADAVVQILTEDGDVILSTAPLPVGDIDLEILAGDMPASIHTVDLDGEQYRVLTAPFAFVTRGFEHPIGAVQFGRSLSEANAVLDGMKRRMLSVGGVGVALAALAGWLIAGRALKPVGELTAAAEHVAATQNLESPIDVQQNDEVGRLASSFNAMLAALAGSKRQQQQLVADAGHELRTPLTSLRTNIELLARAETLPADQKRELLSDATTELEQLSDLVAELVDLATDRSIEEPRTDVRLDQIVTTVAERAERRWNREIRVEVETTVLHARAGGIERAVSNLVENAIKWGPPDMPIDVVQRGGAVTVRDHGDGIAEDDQPKVFDRFYRATAARTMPGSGLGLAIVRQVVEEHGGTVSVENSPDGGALVGFEIPREDESE